MVSKAVEVKKSTSQKAGNTTQILGVGLNGTELAEVLRQIEIRLERGEKSLVVTPNPEFLVYAQSQPWFKKALNTATFAIPDGIGLIWASWFLKSKPRLKQRVAGADLAARLLKLANTGHWQVGVVGARRGDKQERRQLIKKLQQRYPGITVVNLEDTPGWQKSPPAGGWQVIFACQGMGEQEKWLLKHFAKTEASVFVGAGGALDFLTGFAKRAPKCIRRLGFEWLYRLLIQPWRWRRQLALVKFVWLVLKERFST